jgi:hypothetical protein
VSPLSLSLRSAINHFHGTDLQSLTVQYRGERVYQMTIQSQRLSKKSVVFSISLYTLPFLPLYLTDLVIESLAIYLSWFDRVARGARRQHQRRFPYRYQRSNAGFHSSRLVGSGSELHPVPSPCMKPAAVPLKLQGGSLSCS